MNDIGPALVILIIFAAFAGWWVIYRQPAQEPCCPKCGGPTNHHCGMGACVEMCPLCDRL